MSALAKIQREDSLFGVSAYICLTCVHCLTQCDITADVQQYTNC